MEILGFMVCGIALIISSIVVFVDFVGAVSLYGLFRWSVTLLLLIALGLLYLWHLFLRALLDNYFSC